MKESGFNTIGTSRLPVLHPMLARTLILRKVFFLSF